ncbi:MAG: ribonuclease Y [Nitrospinaceae bacterium]|jgi:ribonucrease Y|nr:ribonuclease Y [Nitrospinaceae bacterium]MBT3433300.1 ribonuclease Y [Nitrospinaceae bacterium]MBT3821846.1 ribonuclease Y [Nitrospinaceae bacterium]MBT4092923.1 ribonuclease Y [Nitrospinaceae bacterium]MBT4429586.1 ribonuclease Y [Nitrospinaceae bacterium]
MDVMSLIVGVVVGAGLAGSAVLFISKKKTEEAIGRTQSSLDEKIREVESNSDKKLTQRLKEVEVTQKAELLRQREELERQNESRMEETQKLEQRVAQREETLDKRRETLDTKEGSLEQREQRLGDREGRMVDEEARYKDLQDQALRKLEEVAGMSVESAKKELMDRYMEEAKQDVAGEIQRMEQKAKENVERDAVKAVALAVERYSNDHIAESVVSVVDLPSDEMKGRIIGREGRNIRALEMATGVDVIIDDTPEAVVISCFDNVRRETARLSLESLVLDGRIHPGRIEDVVGKMKNEIQGRIREAGEQAIFEMGLEGFHPELVMLIGRLHYRTSYRQNALKHSLEVAHLTGMLASELRLEPTMAKRAGLLHDIGKASTHEVEGSHVQIGIDIAKRYNEPDEVINAIASHHEDEEANCIEAVLVKAADTLSAARPGARREMVQSYIKRLEALESIAESFKGVEKCYAIQAGREIRVAVTPDEITDAQASFLARDIAKRIEEERTYPGEILVTVIRETRHTATAR